MFQSTGCAMQSILPRGGVVFKHSQLKYPLIVNNVRHLLSKVHVHCVYCMLGRGQGSYEIVTL